MVVLVDGATAAVDTLSCPSSFHPSPSSTSCSGSTTEFKTMVSVTLRMGWILQETLDTGTLNDCRATLMVLAALLATPKAVAVSVTEQAYAISVAATNLQTLFMIPTRGVGERWIVGNCGTVHKHAIRRSKFVPRRHGDERRTRLTRPRTRPRRPQTQGTYFPTGLDRSSYT